MIEKEKKWYALYTRFRHEKRVECQLRQRGIETYLPMRKILRKWSDRKKWIMEPLFKCYIFIYSDTGERFEAIQSHGAVRIITFGGKPAIVKEREINYIRNILSEFPDAETCIRIPVGSRVKICRGQLAGLEGILTESRNKNRMIVFIDSINRGVYFNVDVHDVCKIE
ncbi:MAG: UpxY family transcription antiterminator [bacterium]